MLGAEEEGEEEEEEEEGDGKGDESGSHDQPNTQTEGDQTHNVCSTKGGRQVGSGYNTVKAKACGAPFATLTASILA